MTRILIIDDDVEMCEELSDILKEEHYTVDVCNDAKKGLESIKSDGYAIVLLDLKMPGMRGEEALKYIKEKHPCVKVLVLTGDPVSRKLLQEEEKGEEEGESILFAKDEYKECALNMADGVINKPFDIEKTLTKIKELIGV